MAKLLFLNDMFINNLEINAKVTFKYKETLYQLQKTENKYELYNQDTRELEHTFYRYPYDFFKLVTFNEQSVYDIYKDIEILDKKIIFSSRKNLASTQINAETFIECDYALFKHDKKRYIYYKKNDVIHLNCIFPLAAYFEQQFELATLFFESKILGKNNKRIIDLFAEIIIEEISLY
ncbi:MAG: hypothetical protein ACRC6X_05080 [Culicoidibacterales bacterium]